MPLRLVETKDHNIPWHEFTDSDAFKSALDMVPALAKEAGKFANKANLKKKLMNEKSAKQKKVENIQSEAEPKVKSE